MAKEKSPNEQIVCVNRQARYNYFIDETFEAGLVLLGSEVKSLRDGKANLKDSYARISCQRARKLVRRRQSVQSRADTRAKASAPRAGNRAAHRQDQRARADSHSAETILQEWQSKG